MIDYNAHPLGDLPNKEKFIYCPRCHIRHYDNFMIIVNDKLEDYGCIRCYQEDIARYSEYYKEGGNNE